MTPASRVRLPAALLLALCIALPSYTCPGYVAPDGTVVSSIPDAADSAAYQSTRIAHYPLEDRGPTDGWFWITVAAFGWPLPILLLRRYRPRSAPARFLTAAEPVLALGSGYLIYAMASMGRPAFGTWLALAANGAMLAVWLAERLRLRARERPREAMA